MKHITATILFFTSIFLIFFPSIALGESETNLRKFIITAYYSPLPNQSFYLRGSYEADIRLNGHGTHGASGKPVYVGMLAGPKTYTFGTQIYFKDLGIGTIDDRGGAIVSAGSRGYNADRIDIWMGNGEEGLRRALTWGKKTVFGQVFAPGIVPEGLKPIALENFTIGKINIAQYQKTEEEKLKEKQKTLQTTKVESINIEGEQEQEMNIFTVPIDKSSTLETIHHLQKILKDLSYYTGDVNGKYSPALQNAIYDFQIENQIISGEKNSGAGFYGKKTRTKLKEVYTRYKEYDTRQCSILTFKD